MTAKAVSCGCISTVGRGRDGEAAAVYPVEGYEQWPVRWDKASGELAVTVPAEGGYISRTFEVNFN